MKNDFIKNHVFRAIGAITGWTIGGLISHQSLDAMYTGHNVLVLIMIYILFDVLDGIEYLLKKRKNKK